MAIHPPTAQNPTTDPEYLPACRRAAIGAHIEALAETPPRAGYPDADRFADACLGGGRLTARDATATRTGWPGGSPPSRRPRDGRTGLGLRPGDRARHRRGPLLQTRSRRRRENGRAGAWRSRTKDESFAEARKQAARDPRDDRYRVGYAAGYADGLDTGRDQGRAEEDGPFDPWRVIGIPKGPGRATVRGACRKQCALSHPNKVAHLSGPLQGLAARLTKDVNRTYDVVRKRCDPTLDAVAAGDAHVHVEQPLLRDEGRAIRGGLRRAVPAAPPPGPRFSSSQPSLPSLPS